MKGTRKLLALLLSVCMLPGMLSTAASADETVTIGPGETSEPIVVEGQVSVETEGDSSVATASAEVRQVSSSTVLTVTTGDDASFGDTEITLADCLYTFTASGDGFTVSSGSVYLNMTHNSAGYPQSTVSNTIIFTPNDSGLFALSCTATGTETYSGTCYLYFYRNGNNRFDRQTTLDAAATYFSVYRPAAEGETSLETLPGYVQVTTSAGLTDGGTYLIGAEYDGAIYLLYPSTGTSNKYTHVARAVAEVTRTYETSITFTGAGEGTTSYVIGGTTYNVSVVHVHAYDEGTLTLAPTCTTAGTVTYACTCGDTYTESVPALGHHYTAPTEEELEGGLTAIACDNCGAEVSFSSVENILVEEGTTSEPLEFSTEQSAVVSPDTEVAELTTTYEQAFATCIHYEASVSASTGSTVTGTYSGTPDKLLDRDFDSYFWADGAQQAGDSVTVDLGIQAYFPAVMVASPVTGCYCVDADVQVSADGETWFTLGTHTGSADDVIADIYAVPDDIASFRYIRVLLTTDRVYRWKLAEIGWGYMEDEDSISLAPLADNYYPHEENYATVSFTGKAAGTTVAVVGDTLYLVEVTERHVHSYELTEYVAASCEEDGYKVRECECGEAYTETLPALGHDYDDGEVESGYITYTCQRCGDTYSERVSYVYEKVTEVESGSSYVITFYTGGTYYAMTHADDTIGTVAVTVADGMITSDVTDDMVWNRNGSVFSYTGSDGTTRCLKVTSTRTGWVKLSYSLTLAASGTSAAYSGSRLKLGTNYVRCASGTLSVNSNTYSTCYMFLQHR